VKFAILGSRGFPSTYGGYETLVRHLARYMVEDGHDVTVYCRTKEEGRRRWVTEDVTCIATPGTDTKSLSTLSFGLTSCADAAVRGYDAALVLNIANGFWLPMLRARGIPTALNTDGLEWERGKWGGLAKSTFRVGARLSAKHATALIADSEEMARIWEERFGVGSRFIPYGAPVLGEVATDKLAPLALEPESYVLVVARLIPENNVDLTLDAILRMSPRPRTVIVGSANFDSPLEARLRALEREPWLDWLGHVSDQDLLTQLWAHCGTYVHGHSVGGTNPALLQALGAGAPTLALDTRFNSEVLREPGALYAHDADALAGQIGELLGSAEARAASRQRGRDTVQARYQWNDVCADYVRVLTELAQGRRPS
jgi:glycosyltransferase involved in cell wall biosynthesis